MQNFRIFNTRIIIIFKLFMYMGRLLQISVGVQLYYRTTAVIIVTYICQWISFFIYNYFFEDDIKWQGL